MGPTAGLFGDWDFPIIENETLIRTFDQWQNAGAIFVYIPIQCEYTSVWTGVQLYAAPGQTLNVHVVAPFISRGKSNLLGVHRVDILANGVIFNASEGPVVQSGIAFVPLRIKIAEARFHSAPVIQKGEMAAWSELSYDASGMSNVHVGTVLSNAGMNDGLAIVRGSTVARIDPGSNMRVLTLRAPTPALATPGQLLILKETIDGYNAWAYPFAGKVSLTMSLILPPGTSVGLSQQTTALSVHVAESTPSGAITHTFFVSYVIITGEVIETSIDVSSSALEAKVPPPPTPRDYTPTFVLTGFEIALSSGTATGGGAGVVASYPVEVVISCDTQVPDPRVVAFANIQTQTAPSSQFAVELTTKLGIYHANMPTANMGSMAKYPSPINTDEPSIVVVRS